MGWEAAKAVITWALVIVGWIVLADQQEMREAKKDGLTRLASLRKAASDAKERAVKFHTNPFAAEEQVTVQALLSDLGHTSNFLERIGVVGAGWTSSLRTFRQAAQDENFDLSVHQPLTQSSPVVSAIVIAHLGFDRYLAHCEFQTLMRPITIWSSAVRVLRINRLVSWREARRARNVDGAP